MAERMQICNLSENNFEQCTKCSICTTVCPVAAVTTDYPGPKQAGPDGERYRLKDPAYYDKMLKLCLNCKRCEVACPSGVHIADIIQQARQRASVGKHASLRDTMLANTDLLGTMANLVAPVANATLGLKPTKLVMDSVMAIDKHRTFPAYSRQKFTTWFKRHAAKEQDAFAHHVSYFHGCYVNYNFPKLGQDLVKLMNAVGYGVHMLDKEACCGVALIANGLYKQAKRQANTNADSIRKAVNTLRHNYSQNLSLNQLAEQVNMSPSHLSRTFSKEVGMSISQYVAALRCEEAASMLKNGDASIQEISAYVGYLDNNYFVKVFKRQYGMTPSEYRAGKDPKEA